ncbi:MAG: DUF4419 domain-containing protein [Sphingobacteriaceae bacterium]|nr:MAG: DUF4419 domain-containing protein [Sphingobacteriaceae bacterium]
MNHFIITIGTLRTIDMGQLLSVEMVKLLKANIKDIEMCDWVLPDFSTTTNDDRVVGSIVLMATMQEYFDYKMNLLCGIPEITLLGTPQDWDSIHQRVKKLRSFSECNLHFVEWADMLEKITQNIASSSRGIVNSTSTSF